MKKLFILILVSMALLGFWIWPSLSVNLKDFIFAKVISSELCPKGEGNIFDDEILIYVNKDIALPPNYVPKDLKSIPQEVKTTNAICLKSEVLPYLKNMFDDAKAQNINLAVTSGFRSKETQSMLYKALINLKGESAKNRIAKPLHSEHQLGTTMDFSGGSINYISASDRFGGTVEDLWLRKNAHKYGFVLSYGKDKTLITGYDYEPWHYRFVGIDVAEEIFEQQISVEEYFNSMVNPQNL